MLELRQIVKDYPAGDGQVNALKGISLRFRESEFVSILGPSGCGKTTLLNIIGGLDKYTSGDLIINGKSTKEYKDRDWDAYRNHSIGFIFQSYHLIPHQTVLQNVELALTLSGVSKTERRKRAIKVLEDVGLNTQLNKKPNEMSGGQMQRVAIARALVNNPDIILADEPTGALDSETSVQIMNILKKISQDRLIIMVTHNPNLANTYSTRIIRMLDGAITEDSQPVSDQEATQNAKFQSDKKENGHKKQKLPSMSWGTSFMLSLKNLFTKKGRTALTSFAGSIGIIGIALILAISTGMTSYIDTTQEDALSTYPITIERTTVDLSTLMDVFMNVSIDEVDHERNAVYKRSTIYQMINSLSNIDEQKNDLTSFKTYLENALAYTEENKDRYKAVNGIQYTYDLPLLVYTENVDGDVIKSDTMELMSSLIAEYMGMSMASGSNLGSLDSLGELSNMPSMGMVNLGLWQEMLPGKDGSLISDVLDKQYDVVYGSWPNNYDEVVLVLDENNELDDMTLYALGLVPQEQVEQIMRAAMNGEEIEFEEQRWTYEEICSQVYHVLLNSSAFVYDDATGLYTDLRDTDAGIRYLYDNGIKLKVSGIIRPNENSLTTMLTGSIGYTQELTKHVIGRSQSSPAISAQKDNPSVDVITGLPFKENTGLLSTDDKAAEFRKYIDGLDEAAKAEAYVRIKSIPTQEILDSATQQALQGMTREVMESTLVSGLVEEMGVSVAEIAGYVTAMTDEELTAIFEGIIADQTKQQYAQQVAQQMAAMSPAQLTGALAMEMDTYTAQQTASYYDQILEFSTSSYESNLTKLGYVDLDDPATISIYASSFANKDVIEDIIAEYNEGVDELSQIKYTDYIGIMLSSITTIINAITYVLIAFVTISLVVSSIMIGVITLISVQERVKEIGILRAIGASKRNVSGMFNAETIIIGFASGALGIVISYLLCIPINAIIYRVTGIPNLEATLPVPAALILIAISVALTLISGIIPSRSAAKKDPVVALRTE
ncbi:MAG: ATP-binding cassette domain-containing protein [Candidatus Limiplasma sp.]|nr:ATP-binding cassette domain-containing protein [Candidatus Limiplasma sp.]